MKDKGQNTIALTKGNIKNNYNFIESYIKVASLTFDRKKILSTERFEDSTARLNWTFSCECLERYLHLVISSISCSEKILLIIGTFAKEPILQFDTRYL